MRLRVSVNGMSVQETKKCFPICTRPWLYLSWNMRSLSVHHIQRRTLPFLTDSNEGPQVCSPGDFPRYEERLAVLGSSSPQSMKSSLSLLECYATIHGLNGHNCNDYFEFNFYSKGRSNHSSKVTISRTAGTHSSNQ